MESSTSPNALSELYFAVLDNGGGSVRTGFFRSCLAAFGFAPVQVDFLGDSHAGRARNRAAANFLASGRPYLLFIDGDILFTPQHIQFLMESRCQIQAGIYFKKCPGLEPCLCCFPGQSQLLREVNQAVLRAGTGFMRIHRSAFEALKQENGGPAEKYTNHGRDEWDFFKSGVVNQEWLSEDWYFCDMARSRGIPTMVDGRIQVGHEGSIVYPFDKADADLVARTREVLAKPEPTLEELKAIFAEKVAAPAPTSATA